MESDDAVFILIEENEEAIGYAWIEIKKYKGNPFKFGYHSLYIYQISILGTEQNKGYGTILMEEILSDYKI